MTKRLLVGVAVVLAVVFVVFAVGYSAGISPTGYGLFEWMFNFKAPDYKEVTPIEKITCGNGVCDTGEDFLACPMDCPSKIVPPVIPKVTMVACGNGVLDPGESCDDGNRASGDGCSELCMLECPSPGHADISCPDLVVCGNGIITEGEECDDGNVLDGDGCSSICTLGSCVECWSIIYGSYEYSSFEDVVVDDNGNAYVPGYGRDSYCDESGCIFGPAFNRIRFGKYNKCGSLLWENIYEEANGPVPTQQGKLSAVSLKSGNVYVATSILSSDDESFLSADAWLAKYNPSNGVFLWPEPFIYSGSYPYSNGWNDVAVDQLTGNVYVVGFYKVGVLGGSRDILMAAYNSDGELLWVQPFGEMGESYMDRFNTGQSITVVNGVDPASNGIYVTGSYRRQIWVARYNFDGTLVWNSSYDPPRYLGLDISYDPLSNYIFVLGSRLQDGLGSSTLWLGIFRPDGTLDTTWSYSLPGRSVLGSGMYIYDSKIYIAGYDTNSESYSDIHPLILKLNIDAGSSPPTITVEWISTLIDMKGYATAITFDPFEDYIYVSGGIVPSSGLSTHGWLARYPSSGPDSCPGV